jgi:hypothetical protein
MYEVVQNDGLAFCDPASLRSSDLLATERPQAHYVGEVYYLKYDSRQRFYWLSEQRPNELSLFVTYDSRATEESRGKFPPS